jgi:hypothetical protein
METSSIEMHISEVHAIVNILLFVAEEAEDSQRARLRPAAISLLYIAGDKLDQAEKELAWMV